MVNANLQRVGILEQEAIGALSFFAGDYISAPWGGPTLWGNALYVSSTNKTYVAWLAEGGPQVVRIAAYDHGNNTWSDPVTVANSSQFDDTHGAPTICRDADGYFYMFYGCHNSAIQWAISDSADDITAWTVQTEISGNNTYPRCVLVGSTLYLFYRASTTSSESDNRQVYRSGTPSGGSVTFGSENGLINLEAANEGLYLGEIRANGTDIEFMLTRNTGSLNGIYYAALDTTDGSLDNIDKSTQTASGSLPIVKALLESDYKTHSTGANANSIPTWCRDTSGDLHVCFAEGTIDPYAFKHDIWNGSTWAGTSTVVSLNKLGLGIRRVSLVPGLADKVELWYPDGETLSQTAHGGDTMNRKVYDGSWGAEEEIVGIGSEAIGHPLSVLNAHSKFRVIFSEVTQSETHSGRIIGKRYAYGDKAFIQWPALNESLWPKIVEQVVYIGSDTSTPTDLDESWHSQALSWLGNAQIQSNRLSLDGTGDAVQVGNSGQTAGHWVRRYNFAGEFYVELRGVKFASLTGYQIVWAIWHQSNKSLRIGFDETDTPDKGRVDLGTGGASATNIAGSWAPADTSTEYDFVVTRNASDLVRLHIGVSGGALAEVVNGTFAGNISASSGAILYHGAAFEIGVSKELNGTIRAIRVIDGTDRGVTGSNHTPDTLPWATN